MRSMKIILCSCLLALLPSQTGCGRKTSSLRFEDASKSSDFLCPSKLSQIVDCKENESYIYVAPGYCAAYDSSQKQLLAAPCPYVFPQQMIHNNRLRLSANSALLNVSLCGGLHRSVGPTLCGRCQNGTGLTIHSVGSQCTECHLLHILWYILLQYLPMTLLFTVIFTLRANITSAPTVFYILYCIIYTYIFKTDMRLYSTYFLYVPSTWRVLGHIQLTLCGIWSLDFFRFVAPPLCVSEHLTEMHVLLLEVLETLYLIALIMLAASLIKLHKRGCGPIHTLWKPFNRLFLYLVRAWNPDGAAIHACATFFFLSYTKLLAISLQMAGGTPVYNQRGHVIEHIVYADPTMKFNSRDHTPYLTLSAMLVLLIVLPLVVLTLYTTRLFQMCLCNRPHCKSALKSFVDTFYSSYRDGTDGGWDYRPLSGVILLAILIYNLIRVAVFKMGQLTSVNDPHMLCTMYLLYLVVFAVLRPYKKWTANALVLAGLGFYACIENLALDLPGSVVLLFTFLPHIVFVVYIAYKICKCFVEMLRKYGFVN